MINKKWSWKWEKNTTTKKKMRYIACYDYHSQLTVLQKAPSTLCRNFWNVLKDCWQTLPLTFAISLIFSIGVAFFLALFNSISGWSWKWEKKYYRNEENEVNCMLRLPLTIDSPSEGTQHIMWKFPGCA